MKPKSDPRRLPNAEEAWAQVQADATQKADRIRDWLKANKKNKGRIWAEVEELLETDFDLKQISDRLYQEGEYGES